MTLLAHEAFLVEIGMSETEYVGYLMSETNVEAAVAGGVSEGDAWNTCSQIFGPLFSGERMPVTFRAVFALARAAAPA